MLGKGSQGKTERKLLRCFLRQHPYWRKFCCNSKWYKKYWRRLQLSFDISNIDIWSLVTVVIHQIGKQTGTISVFWALEALFVAEKSFVVNQNDKKIIEEDSSFHLTYQTLISVHWWLVIEQICKQTVTISVFWALEALFVAEKSFVVNQNDWKFIEEDSSFHLTCQTLISDHWWL